LLDFAFVHDFFAAQVAVDAHAGAREQDIEAEAIAASLSLGWRRPARLWFYVA
jgi:hypothetical protein